MQALFLLLVMVEQRCLWRRAHGGRGIGEGADGGGGGADGLAAPLLDRSESSADAGAAHKANNGLGS